MKIGIDSQKAKTLNYLILGIGMTGVSMVTFCVKEGLNFIVADSRENTAGIKLIRDKYPNIKIYSGSFSALKLEGIDVILKSPGINLHDPIIQRAVQLGIHILSEIDLFFSKVRAPVVAITGSNGKSTVTTLVGLVAESEGLNVGVGGNLGTPMLELINSSRDLYVLELSSYQLELVDNMYGAISCILNITPDHIDRHKTMQTYIASKSNILKGASVALLNKDDPIVSSINTDAEKKYFSLSDVKKKLSSMDSKKSNCHISFEDGSVMILDKIMLSGDHNLSNVVAVLKLCKLA
ncbi:MAG: UDP-N-acetylmuramoyl-L-alanine--D-glutamate ligase, partial [Pseudomonadota bacterium]|nr:UDP-N-acetylmuramoyl-L-alanine--D-glutamate ligase [Pseudomonadota bacterium]